ncbi:hypothetical protein jhhlp_003506 [Lomentospora prolificans]|uniref:Uncharacterized protein n=1 Tax=Lomentospora prolificans TaxID=41688 RepID=A0A2N3N8X1_9PEZI|nr:hypothetical protein jhhlp_003506 [Lomentospora prolificans]
MATTRKNLASGSPFEDQIGYCRAVVTHPWVFVSGTTGYDYATNTLPPTVVEQTKNIISTITTTLKSAGATPQDIVRVTYLLPDRSEFPSIWPLLRDWLDGGRPAATMIQTGLMEEAMKIEIEVTAMIGSGEGAERVPPPA